MHLIKRFNKEYFPFTVKNVSLLLFTWLLAGFSLGTLTLLWPVRWIVNLCRSSGFSENIESLLIKIVIFLFIIASLYFSVLICKMIIRKKSFLLNIYTISSLVIITSVFTWLWMNPSLMQLGSREITEEKVGNVEFFFGPYPRNEELIKLKNDGFTAVISLLHPAVVPFESKLISDEEKLAKSIGIKLLHAPMLPWISENKTSLQEIKNLALNTTGKYYVHCYLGKDRVNTVKRIIKQFSSSIVSIEDSSQRKITDLGTFERGEIIELDKGIYLTPFPTDDEFFGYILNGSFKKIVSLLNPKNPDDTMWINREETICKSSFMPYELLPIEMRSISSERILEIANKIKEMPRPLLVHAFLSKSPEADALIDAYKIASSQFSSDLFDKQLH